MKYENEKKTYFFCLKLNNNNNNKIEIVQQMNSMVVDVFVVVVVNIIIIGVILIINDGDHLSNVDQKKILKKWYRSILKDNEFEFTLHYYPTTTNYWYIFIISRQNTQNQNRKQQQQQKWQTETQLGDIRWMDGWMNTRCKIDRFKHANFTSLIAFFTIGFFFKFIFWSSFLSNFLFSVVCLAVCLFVCLFIPHIFLVKMTKQNNTFYSIQSKIWIFQHFWFLIYHSMLCSLSVWSMRQCCPFDLNESVDFYFAQKILTMIKFEIEFFIFHFFYWKNF